MVKDSFCGVRTLRTAEIELRAQPGTLEREWVLNRLMAQSGVEDASWSQPHASLVIEYDPALLSEAELVNILYLCGPPASK